VPLRRKPLTFRRTLYKVINGKTKIGKFVEWFILFLIIINVVLFIISSEPVIVASFQYNFEIIEAVCIGLFMAEYIIRLWTCVEKRKYYDMGLFFGRLRFSLKLSTIVDALAIVPFWIAFVAGLGYVSLDISFASAIRIFRIFKLFKAEKYFKAIKILSMVIRNNKEVLMMTVMLGVITFTLTATGLWIAEKDNPANPEFYSIPSSMYMSLLMLCGLNIPEHMTGLGKMVVAVTGIFSIAVFAIPTGIIAWGFEPVASELIRIRSEKKEMKRKKRLMKGLMINSDEPMENIDLHDIPEKIHQCPHCDAEFSCYAITE